MRDRPRERIRRVRNIYAILTSSTSPASSTATAPTKATAARANWRRWSGLSWKAFAYSWRSMSSERPNLDYDPKRPRRRSSAWGVLWLLLLAIAAAAAYFSLR